MKIYGFLPAKGNSERVENKNMRFLQGKPLFVWSLMKLLDVNLIDTIYLDTECNAIIDAAYKYCSGFMPHRRDNALATNATNGHGLMYHEALAHPDADIYVQIMCTSPFLRKESIFKAIHTLVSYPEYDSVVGVRSDKMFFFKGNQPEFKELPRSQDLPTTVMEAMSLYVVRKEVALNMKRRIGNNPYLLELSKLETVDIDTPEEFEFAEIIAKGLKNFGKDSQFF